MFPILMPTWQDISSLVKITKLSSPSVLCATPQHSPPLLPSGTKGVTSWTLTETKITSSLVVFVPCSTVLYCKFLSLQTWSLNMLEMFFNNTKIYIVKKLAPSHPWPRHPSPFPRGRHCSLVSVNGEAYAMAILYTLFSLTFSLNISQKLFHSIQIDRPYYSYQPYVP